MDVEALRIYCLAKPHTMECFPFDETTLVFKTCNKMFALVSLDSTPLRTNLKCDPDKAIELREEMPHAILPGYHMNKRHWNTIIIEEVSSALLKELIDHSYELIVASLSKKARLEYFPED